MRQAFSLLLYARRENIHLENIFKALELKIDVLDEVEVPPMV